MAKIPKFAGGKIGKLTHGDLNVIASNVNDLRTHAETAPPQSKVNNQFQFPIFAILGEAVEPEDPPDPVPAGDENKDDGEEKLGEEDKPINFNGYEWAEVVYDGSTGQWEVPPDRRFYDSNAKNLAFPLRNYPTEYLKRYAGELVMLFPSLDKYARPILVFERPTPIVGNATIGRITSKPHLDCRSEPGGYYDIEVYQVAGDSNYGENGLILESFNPFPGFSAQPLAVNMTEQSGFGLGGSVTSSDCDIESLLTPIPVGTYVQITFLSFIEAPEGVNAGSRPLYGFNLANDLCVSCCTQEGMNLPEGFKRRDPTQSPRRASVINSIQAEMMR